MPPLAGLFALKCRFKIDYFQSIIEKIDLFTESFYENFGNENFNHMGNLYKYKKMFKNIKTGYDELILMCLIEPIFSTNYVTTNQGTDEETITLIKAQSILKLVGFPLNGTVNRLLKYNNSIDITSNVLYNSKYTDDLKIQEAIIKKYTIGGIPYPIRDNMMDIDDYYNSVKLLYFDKHNMYYDLISTIENNFIYCQNYMNILNYGTLLKKS